MMSGVRPGSPLTKSKLDESKSGSSPGSPFDPKVQNKVQV
jgi:hypothetical protein